jgi:hypothetical protein
MLIRLAKASAVAGRAEEAVLHMSVTLPSSVLAPRVVTGSACLAFVFGARRAHHEDPVYGSKKGTPRIGSYLRGRGGAGDRVVVGSDPWLQDVSKTPCPAQEPYFL